MSDIMESSKFQNLNLQPRVFGPFFNISAKSLDTEGQEPERADGFMRVWFGGRILHLDSIRLRRERLSLKRFIFGTGLHMGPMLYTRYNVLVGMIQYIAYRRIDELEPGFATPISTLYWVKSTSCRIKFSLFSYGNGFCAYSKTEINTWELTQGK